MKKQLGTWLGTQHKNCNPENRKCIMKEDDIYQLWKDFVLSSNFSVYFPSEKKWYSDFVPYAQTADDGSNSGKIFIGFAFHIYAIPGSHYHFKFLRIDDPVALSSQFFYLNVYLVILYFHLI